MLRKLTFVLFLLFGAAAGCSEQAKAPAKGGGGAGAGDRVPVPPKTPPKTFAPSP